MSEGLTATEARNVALCLLAADSAACDGLDPEQAVAFARKLEAALDTPPWKDGAHAGDCTKQPHSCIRCQIEDAESEARARYEL